MNTTAQLRFDGYYKTEYEVADFSGNLVKIPCIFIFNKHMLVGNYKHDDAYQLLRSNESDVKELLLEMSLAFEIDITLDASKYETKAGKIFMFFMIL